MQQQLNGLRESLNNLRRSLGIQPSLSSAKSKVHQVLDAIDRRGLKLESIEQGERVRIFGNGIEIKVRSLADVDLSLLK